MMVGHRLTQRFKTLDRKIVLFPGMLPKRLDNHIRYGKWRLPQSEFEDLLPSPSEQVRAIVDADRRGG